MRVFLDSYVGGVDRGDFGRGVVVETLVHHRVLVFQSSEFKVGFA